MTVINMAVVVVVKEHNDDLTQPLLRPANTWVLWQQNEGRRGNNNNRQISIRVLILLLFFLLLDRRRRAPQANLRIRRKIRPLAFENAIKGMKKTHVIPNHCLLDSELKARHSQVHSRSVAVLNILQQIRSILAPSRMNKGVYKVKAPLVMVVGIWTFPSLLVHGEAIGHKAEDEEEGLLLPFLGGYWRYRIFQGNQEKTRIYKAKRERESCMVKHKQRRKWNVLFAISFPPLALLCWSLLMLEIRYRNPNLNNFCFS